jgi:hypothetical protein
MQCNALSITELQRGVSYIMYGESIDEKKEEEIEKTK